MNVGANYEAQRAQATQLNNQLHNEAMAAQCRLLPKVEVVEDAKTGILSVLVDGVERATYEQAQLHETISQNAKLHDEVDALKKQLEERSKLVERIQQEAQLFVTGMRAQAKLIP